MNISSLNIFGVKSLIKEKVHEVKIEKRYKNLLSLRHVEKDVEPVITNGMVHNGIFGFPSNSFFLTEILIENFNDINLNDEEEVIKTLNSKHGRNLQRVKFRKEFLKPIKKWLKNRDISNINVGRLLLRSKIEGSFEDFNDWIKANPNKSVDVSTISIFLSLWKLK